MRGTEGFHVRMLPRTAAENEAIRKRVGRARSLHTETNRREAAGAKNMTMRMTPQATGILMDLGELTINQTLVSYQIEKYGAGVQAHVIAEDLDFTISETKRFLNELKEIGKVVVVETINRGPVWRKKLGD